MKMPGKILFNILFFLSVAVWPVYSQSSVVSNEDCFVCHEQGEPLVNRSIFDKSVHSSLNCVDCHADLAGKELPHDIPLASVECGTCHSSEQAEFSDSLHGKSLAQGDKLAPRCQNCHGYHDILPLDDPNSKVSALRIPFVCGSCHSEGSPVQVQREIHQDHILENYSESIHGEGLFKKGLIVSATCVSCHQAHQILPHTDARSSIASQNIVSTCLKCHTQIESVHRKVIKGELWEKTPQSIPVCVDCHQPHKVRKVFYDQGVADKDCLTCHGNKELTSSQNGRSLFVDTTELTKSIHEKISCSQCHTQISISQVRACETIKDKVDCAICHAGQVEQYQQGIHGKLNLEKDPNAPGCAECHGIHATLSQKNLESPTYPTNVPALCARCHRENEKAAVRYKGKEHEISEHYVESIHGKGLLKSGLVVTAMCTNCHTAHKELPSSDPGSSVNRQNIAMTCAQCHKGVYEKYSRSIHAFGKDKDSNKLLPVCSDCHTAHTIKRTDMDKFKFEIMNVCGKCHLDIANTYFETFHGKVTKLGYAKTAKCHDCHGSHEILPVTDPNSTLSRENILKTCQQCHEGAPKRFAGYLTHATHHDPHKYPWVFWTFWVMTGLLIFTFTVSGLHTLLWLPRSLQFRRAHPPQPYNPEEKQYLRFPLIYRIMHATMIVSFLTLAITGMTLKFSYTRWASWISFFLGGVEVSGFIHRCAAVLMFLLFVIHIGHLCQRKRREYGSWKKLLFGPDTMLFNLRDIKEFVGSVKWYLGIGPRPRYGRWTYWEKFDYFAVFWGIMVIGTSGLMLWFPEFFTHFLPGWLINVASIIHSDEALLATGFIFTIHFFNTHFRPEKFPMDKVIFTGRMSVEELKHERPSEYEALIAKNELEKNLVDPLGPKTIRTIEILAWIALAIGISLIVGIICAMVFVYK
ncbi:MAG: cytochrome c3 family protein [Candidatus Omnitrophica bacterium]|nr:cytochrome c3 family protein [Candidatus Omnitrophota bacterium]